MLAERLDAAPDDFARGGQRVEVGRVVALDAAPRGSPARKSRPPSARPGGCRSRRAARRARRGARTTPCQLVSSRRQDRRIDRLDLLAQLGQRAPPDRLQDIGIAPLAAGSARAELALEQPSCGGQLLEQRLRGRAAQAVARGELDRRERARACARSAARDRARRVGVGSSSDSGSPDGSGTPSASR